MALWKLIAKALSTNRGSAVEVEARSEMVRKALASYKFEGYLL
jgi:hypothetical protein